MKLTVDTREKSPFKDIARTFCGIYGVEYAKPACLDAGDVLTKHVVCERKTLGDFYGSVVGSKVPQRDDVIRQGYMYEQMNNLMDFAEQSKEPMLPMVIIVNNAGMGVEYRGFSDYIIWHETNSHYRISDNWFSGTCMSLIVRYQIPVMVVENDFELLRHVHKGTMKIAAGNWGTRRELPKYKHKDSRITAVRQICQCTERQAVSLLEEFHSVIGILNAESYELMNVDGIGRHTANKLYTHLHSSPQTI